MEAGGILPVRGEHIMEAGGGGAPGLGMYSANRIRTQYTGWKGTLG